jgi:molybdate transport system substrate-binding protein
MRGLRLALFGSGNVGRRVVAVALLGVSSPGSARADEVVVFAAASLSDAIAEIAKGFEALTGHEVVVSFAGSNELARQIRAGAPAAVFVSAHPGRVDELEKAGLVAREDRVDLLGNRLVVIVPAGSRLEMARPEHLAAARRIALADPQSVPAGIYAREWLTARGMWDLLKGRVVPTLDVRAALAAVDSGSVDAGIVYRTDLSAARSARVAFAVPPAEAPRIVYIAALLKPASSAARAFYEHLRSHAAREVFERYGFEPLAP